MADLQIREVRLRDATQVLEIARASFPEERALQSLSPAGVRGLFCLYRLLRALQRLRGKPWFKMYVAEAGGQVVAGVMVDWHRRYAYVRSLMVHPEFRGQGIGRRLLSHAVEEAFRFGAPKVVLDVRADNTLACRLYESLGFRTFEERVELLREASPLQVETSWPRGFRCARVCPWDRRVWKALEASRTPEAAAVYGPWSRFSLLRRLVFRRIWLVAEAQGQAAALLILGGKNPVRLNVLVLPEYEGAGLEEALLALGLREARGKTVALRTRAHKTRLLRVAQELGFQEKARVRGMVLEKSG